MTTEPTYAELQATVELLKTRAETLTTLVETLTIAANNQIKLKMELHAKNQETDRGVAGRDLPTQSGVSDSETTQMKLLLILLTLAGPVYSDPMKAEDKTKRMGQIETKYHVTIAGILRTDHEDYWIFMESMPSTTFGRLPIVILANSTDHDFVVARIAAENCAAYYDTEITRAKPIPGEMHQ